MTQKSSWLPTPAQQAEIDAHWANVRSGLRSDMPEPEYKTPKEVIEMHRYLARKSIEAAAWHARQAASTATGGREE